jgi:hypothetical protein
MKWVGSHRDGTAVHAAYMLGIGEKRDEKDFVKNPQ